LACRSPGRAYCGNVGVATPLFVAARHEHFGIVQYLVGKGADVNGKGTCPKNIPGPTPLQGVLCRSYDSKIRANVKAIALLLLESGADPNPREGWPIWTYSMCDSAITTALVQHGLKLDQRTYNGDTILHQRVKKQWLIVKRRKLHREMAFFKLLVNNGADLMARDSYGFTPILIAAANGSWTGLDYMLERDDIIRKEKIDALEMAAARILSSNNWESDEQERALEYLRKALRSLPSITFSPT